MKAVDEAVEFADNSPFPDLASLYDDVYVIGDQVQQRPWYSTDSRSPDTHRGEEERDAGDVARELAEAGALHEEDPRRRHARGARPGRGRLMAEMRYREALNLALREEMKADEKVFLMGEDIGVFQGAFKVTAGLLEEFGEKRVRDTPISENTIVGMGVGAAMAGLRPVVELMTINFSLLALDQIINSAASIRYMFGAQVKVPLVIRMPQGAGHQLGPTHSHSFEALYTHIPGLLVAAPTTAADARGLLKAAIRDDNPVIFIEHETLYGRRGEVPENGDEPMRFGEAAVRREGDGVTIVGISRMAETALKGAEILSAEHEHRGRGDRPAHAAPAGPRHDPRVGEQDQPRGDRGGGLAPRRRGREHGRADPGAGVRLARRAGGPRDRRRRADALLQAARAGRVPPRGARGAGGDRHVQGRLMASDVVMPRLSDSMEEGTVLKWLVERGRRGEARRSRSWRSRPTRRT